MGKTPRGPSSPTVAAQLAGVAALVLALGTSFFTTTSGEVVPSHLPGMRGAILVLFAVQLVLIPVLVGTVALQHNDPHVRLGAVVLLAAVALKLVVVALWALKVHADGDLAHPGTPPIIVDVALVLVGVILAWVVVSAIRRTPKPVTFVTATDGDGPHGMPPVAAGGLGAPLVAVLAWLYSIGLSAGIGLQIAQYLGHPVTSTAQAGADNAAFLADLNSGNPTKVLTAWATDTPLIVPPGYIWAGVGAVAVALVGVGIGAYVALRSLKRRRKSAEPEAAVDYAQVEDPTDSAKDATNARALATLTDDAGVLAGLLVGATLLVGFVGARRLPHELEVGRAVVPGVHRGDRVLAGRRLRRRARRARLRVLAQPLQAALDRHPLGRLLPSGHAPYHPLTPPPLQPRRRCHELRDTDRVTGPGTRPIASCSRATARAASSPYRRCSARGRTGRAALRLLLHGSPGAAACTPGGSRTYFCGQLMLRAGRSRIRTVANSVPAHGLHRLDGTRPATASARRRTQPARPAGGAAESEVDQEVADPPLPGGGPARAQRLLARRRSTAQRSAARRPGDNHSSPTASGPDSLGIETIPAAGASSVQE